MLHLLLIIIMIIIICHYHHHHYHHIITITIFTSSLDNFTFISLVLFDIFISNSVTVCSFLSASDSKAVVTHEFPF